VKIDSWVSPLELLVSLQQVKIIPPKLVGVRHILLRGGDSQEAGGVLADDGYERQQQSKEAVPLSLGIAGRRIPLR
jgi:hypothetical protein